MSKKNQHPRWWQTWSCLLLFGAVCFLEARAPLSAFGHKAFLIGSVLLVYGLLALGLRANQGTLLRGAYDELTRHMAHGPAWAGQEPTVLSETGERPESPPGLSPRPAFDPESEWPVARQMMRE